MLICKQCLKLLHFSTKQAVSLNSQRPTALLDSDCRIFFYRTSQIDWLADSEELFQGAAGSLLDASLASEAL